MRSFVKVGVWKTSFDLSLTAALCCRIITSFMKPLEGTDSGDCFRNVHLCKVYWDLGVAATEERFEICTAVFFSSFVAALSHIIPVFFSPQNSIFFSFQV